MNSRSFTAMLLAGVMTAAVAPVALAAPAQKAAPRTADGHSDFDGVWTNVSITPLERPAEYGDRKALTKEEAAKLEGSAVARFIEGNAPTDPNAPATDTTSKMCKDAGGLDCGYNSGWKDSGTTVMRVNGEPRTSFITSTPNGKVPPYKAGAKPVTQRRPDPKTMNDNPEGRSPGERCLLSFGYSAGPVMLPLMYNNNYQFIQNKDEVAILVEMVHDVRHIRLNAKEHLPSDVRPWLGDSIGHWEGATLVAETTNFPALQNFRGSSENLKVTERFTRTGENSILYQFTVEDPTLWDKPWGGEYEFSKANGQVYEYACHEGNYALEGILSGARAEEAEQATKTAEAGAARQ